MSRTIEVVCPLCEQRTRALAASSAPRCVGCRAPLPWITPADDSDFDRVATGSSLPVLVDLWAPWCGYSLAIEPAVVQAAQMYAGRLKVVMVNVDDAPATGQRMGAANIPTLVVLDRGTVLARQVGALPDDDLLRWVASAMRSRVS